MNEKTNPRFCITLIRCSTRLPHLLGCVGMFLWLIGRSVAGNESTQPNEQEPNSSQAQVLSAASKSSNTDSKRGAPDLQGLAGRSPGEVESTLGKPNGRLQNAQGALWLYAEWRVQFDRNSHVVAVEKDQPVRLSKLDPHFVATADAVAKGANERAAAEDAARVRAAALREDRVKIVSNGGQQVDLSALVAPGKITIVDFYAEWCGPCRKMSPQLEQLTKDDPDVVLLKIDIVNWETPVTRQFGIESIPNVRVFGRTGSQLGEATSDAGVVMKRVEQAKRS